VRSSRDGKKVGNIRIKKAAYTDRKNFEEIEENIMAQEYISKEGLEKLRKRLEHLILEERPNIIGEIARTRQFGDLSENAEYHAAKEKQRFIEAEISKFQAKLACLKVINTDDIDKNSIRFGATVELLDKRRNKILNYKIVGEDETGKTKSVRMISFKSPIAQALLGKNIGETVKVKAPVGILEYTIKILHMRSKMNSYRIAWLPGDGVGNDVMEAAKIILDTLELDAEYIHGDIGWEFWKTEGNPLPDRTIELLNNVDCALFGAITSKPKQEAEAELSPELQGKGLVYSSPIVGLRQKFNLHTNLRPCKAFKGNPLNYRDDIDIVVFRENTEGLYSGVEFHPVPENVFRCTLKEP